MKQVVNRFQNQDSLKNIKLSKLFNKLLTYIDKLTQKQEISQTILQERFLENNNKIKQPFKPQPRHFTSLYQSHIIEMRRQQQSFPSPKQSNPIQNGVQVAQKDKNQHEFSKMNQTLTSQSYALLFVLVIVAILKNTSKGYDYNIAIACGVYYLSTKHPFIYKMPFFYVIIAMTITADVIVVALLMGKVSIFHSFIFPIIEIILKILLLVLEGLRWFNENRQSKQLQEAKVLNKSQIQMDMQNQQELQKKTAEYYQKKRSNSRQHQSAAKYYQPKYSNDLKYKEDYKMQAYNEFNQLQYDSDDGAGR